MHRELSTDELCPVGAGPGVTWMIGFRFREEPDFPLCSHQENLEEMEEIGPELSDAPAAHSLYLFQRFDIGRRGLGDDLQQGPRKDHTHMKSKFLGFDLPPRLETLEPFSRFMRRGLPRRARAKHERRGILR